MPDGSTSEHRCLAAGDFSPWMIEMSDAIRGNRASDRRNEGTGHTTIVDPDPEVVRAEVMRQTGVRPVSRPRGRRLH